MPSNLMTKEAAQRIQTSQAQGGHSTGPGSFSDRAKEAAARNENKENASAESGNTSGSGHGGQGQGQGQGQGGVGK
ncbi:MAG: hypothetical protein Q9201_004769 [Fulgogasparrea decipioides]